MSIALSERPKVVSRNEWLAARMELLVKEKQLTRQRDEIDRQRRELPRVKVEKTTVSKVLRESSLSPISLQDAVN